MLQTKATETTGVSDGRSGIATSQNLRVKSTSGVAKTRANNGARSARGNPFAASLLLLAGPQRQAHITLENHHCPFLK